MMAGARQALQALMISLQQENKILEKQTQQPAFAPYYR
jgi:hypothetical protein